MLESTTLIRDGHASVALERRCLGYGTGLHEGARCATRGRLKVCYTDGAKSDRP
jgi:hypothetical protein